ncbi:hypothetical protein DWG18_01245 [Lysobacter sp. TY2-98]|uniref:hypothetical protein n=1 Tax=Lysobacter sp. TY2-98 TaxID=2290922 RepID=UPI000E203C66|nr:hypothetical protein [Lysobacter sp. TY2-98]AXK71045.1 hypothetical protein DWG18_01245 [Lysobacter sp. TY2-98]
MRVLSLASHAPSSPTRPWRSHVTRPARRLVLRGLVVALTLWFATAIDAWLAEAGSLGSALNPVYLVTLAAAAALVTPLTRDTEELHLPDAFLLVFAAFGVQLAMLVAWNLGVYAYFMTAAR